MESIMSLNNFNINEAKKKLWIEEKDLVKLFNTGHSIGLHSDSHPTVMSNLTFEEQYSEYYKNIHIAFNITSFLVFVLKINISKQKFYLIFVTI